MPGCLGLPSSAQVIVPTASVMARLRAAPKVGIPLHPYPFLRPWSKRLTPCRPAPRTWPRRPSWLRSRTCAVRWTMRSGPCRPRTCTRRRRSSPNSCARKRKPYRPGCGSSGRPCNRHGALLSRPGLRPVRIPQEQPGPEAARANPARQALRSQEPKSPTLASKARLFCQKLKCGRQATRSTQGSATVLQAWLRSGRLWVDLAFGDGGQLLICRLLLIQGLLQHARAVLAAELLRPGNQGAVAGNLVVLHRLRGRQESRVERVFIRHLAGNFVRLLHEPVESRAIYAFGRMPVHLEDLLEPRNLILCLLEVSLKATAQLRVGGLVDHLGQSLRDLVLGVVDVLQLMHEQVIKALDVF